MTVASATHPMRGDLLTILLPTKGRHLHTLRFLWHANEIKLPYRILVADGEVHPRIAELLEDPATFSSLSIDYVRYPKDVTFGHFFRKIADAAQRINTAYVKMVDNDDFLVPTGLSKCLQFLEGNLDYVCCGGGLAGFAIDDMSGTALPQVLGRVNRYAYRYTKNYTSRDLAAVSLKERVLDAYRNYKTTYYDVFRTDALQTIWTECAEIDFSDAQLHEYFCALRTVTLGKARSDASNIFYLRQYGTSGQAAFKKDWVHHLVHSRFSKDLDTTVDRISGLVAKADGGAAIVVAEELREITAVWLRTFLKQTYAINSVTIKEHLRSSMPDWFMKLRRMRHAAVWHERNLLFRRLRGDGAPESYLATFRGELETIERLLRDSSFLSFLQQRVPGLLPSSERG
jgi:glycosyltransferase domain-containing protein